MYGQCEICGQQFGFVHETWYEPCEHVKEKVNMTDETVITTDVERGYKLCKCAECNEVSRCTPYNDFYSTEKHGDEIICESCFHIYMRDFMKNRKRLQENLK